MTRITKLSLQNFRNHISQSFEISNNMISIIGPNGSGKTNILEAISLLSPGKGFRGAKLSDMQNFSQGSFNRWGVNILAESINGDSLKMGTGIDFDRSGNEKRIVKINGDKISGQNGLVDYISIFWLVPSNDQIFSSGTTSRREYLDRICSHFFTDYSASLAAYNNMKSQRRNILLSGLGDENWLSSIEKTMAEKAIAVAYSRLEVIEKLNENMEQASQSGFPKARLSVSGDVENWLEDYTAIKAEQKFTELLKQNRNEDRESQKTNCGIHRSDFRAVHCEKNTPAEISSQGEQKAILLSITLASVLAKKSSSNEAPILLLDEVTAHLDENKRNLLFDFIKDADCQTWMTGTEKSDFEKIADISDYILL